MSELSSFTTDLVEQARKGELDPVIGRDAELRRAMQIIGRRSKNNPVLVGPPGVGKTAIVEGLARRIAQGTVPESLLNKRILSLDLGMLLGGTRYRGDFEERLKKVIGGVISDPTVILFIDELHAVIGAGGGDGALDAANILKPALARREFSCIGATTDDEYQRHISRDKALSRRFQPVHVREPSTADALTMLRGIKDRYEGHHKVRIHDGALQAAVVLSSRFICDRFLPDKAIDVIDEAASQLKIELESVPEVIASAEDSLLRLQIEERALAGDNDADLSRLQSAREEIKVQQRKLDWLHQDWTAQREMVAEIRELLAREESLRVQEESSRREGKLQDAAELTYNELPAISRCIEELELKLQTSFDGVALRDSVREQDAIAAVAAWTGMPEDELQAALDEERSSDEVETKPS